jgi:hypothetical protein
MNQLVARAAIAAVWLAGCFAGMTLSAETDMQGHWTGSLEGPAGSVDVVVDLDKADHGWIGSMSFPAQGATGLPLDAISFNAGKGSFHLKGVPGDPTFTGSLSADGEVLQGDFISGGMSHPLKLSRTGEAKVEVVKPSPTVAPEFVGTWEGALDVGPGSQLHLVLTITNGKAGADGMLVSVDQGNAQIPVSGITQKETKLSLQVNAVGGNYEGEINKQGTQLDGTWTQAGNSFPLQLKKKAQ